MEAQSFRWRTKSTLVLNTQRLILYSSCKRPSAVERRVLRGSRLNKRQRPPGVEIRAPRGSRLNKCPYLDSIELRGTSAYRRFFVLPEK